MQGAAKKPVTPAMVVVALLILAIIIVGIWYLTMGRKPKKAEVPSTAGRQPQTPEEARRAGYPAGGGGMPGRGGPRAPAGR